MRASTFSRFRNRYLFLLDLLLIILAVLGSFALRLELGGLYRFYFPAALWMAGIALLVKPGIYYLFGLYRRLWAYASTSELKTIVAAVTVAAGIVSTLMILLVNIGWVRPGFPRSALLIDWVLSILAAGGLRFSLRLLSEASSAQPQRLGEPRRVIIIGAGDAGALVVRELQKNRQMNLTPVGFLDDDPAKQNHQVYGVRVIGTLKDLAHVLTGQVVHEVIIAIPTAPGRVVRAVADICRLQGVPFRTMPGIFELIGGKVSVSRLREVDITDLLRREPARIHEEMIGLALKGRRVLVTGAGGSIGRELCRQISRWEPSELYLLGHGENSIWEILLELRDNFPALPIKPLIADIRHRERLEQIFARLSPQVIFHAAAHKHVPLMESNPEESITNNVLGTHYVVEAALAHGTERLVLISTDKAVNPSSVYGATKRLSEMIVLDAAVRSGQAYSVVRFGNVLGSRGSIIPLWKQQIARGGPVTITHPDMRRFFMTIPEAVHLVLQASSMGRGGEVFVLNMGEQVRILDLAEDLIRLSGLEPGRDVEIAFTGIRPGEKLSEELWDHGTPYEKTPHPDILSLNQCEDLRAEELQYAIERLSDMAWRGDVPGIVGMLDAVIPGASIDPTLSPPDEMSVV